MEGKISNEDMVEQFLMLAKNVKVDKTTTYE